VPRIFFNLEFVDEGHRTEMEGRLAVAASGSRQTKIALARGEADWVVSLLSSNLLAPAGDVFRAKLRDDFVWDAGDFPTGLDLGFYCSLPSILFSPKIHRTFAYPVRYNELVQPFDLEDATRLYSFVGGITSGIRARMAKTLSSIAPVTNGEFRVSPGPWNSMFDRSASTIKIAYADSLRRAKFILCPRGNGVASIRMFESMEAQRVPVVLSDHYVFPEGVDWKTCALVIREKEIACLPEIIREAEPRWEKMAAAARRTWEGHFSNAVMLDEIARHLATLQHARHWWAKPACLALRTKMRAKQVLPGIINRLRLPHRP